MKITIRECERLAKLPKEQVTSRPTFWDDDVPGFGVRVTGVGRLTFLMRYRVKGSGTQRKAKLGDFPSVKPDQARIRAGAIRTAAAHGRDLLDDEKAERDQTAEQAAAAERAKQEADRLAVPLTELLDGWRARVEAELAGKLERGRLPKYEKELLRLEAKNLRPEIEAETIGSLNPDRFGALIALQPSPNMARNVRTVVIRFCRYANAEMTRRGLSVRWPTTFEVTGRPRRRTHRYRLDEAAALWIAAGTMGRRGAMLRFMLLTGCRSIEARRATWPQTELDDPVVGPHWLQPAEMTKTDQPHRVPLAPPAIALLRWLPPRQTKKSGVSPLIFAGRGNKVVGDMTTIRRHLLETAGVDAGTLHDFRRSIVSALGDHGFDPQVADTLLNHAAATTMGGVMSVYQRSELWKKRREAIELWADLLMGAVAKRLGCEPGPRSWGLDQPFADVRIVRPERAGPRSAPRSGIPGKRGKKKVSPKR